MMPPTNVDDHALLRTRLTTAALACVLLTSSGVAGPNPSKTCSDEHLQQSWRDRIVLTDRWRTAVHEAASVRDLLDVGDAIRREATDRAGRGEPFASSLMLIAASAYDRAGRTDKAVEACDDALSVAESTMDEARAHLV